MIFLDCFFDFFGFFSISIGFQLDFNWIFFEFFFDFFDFFGFFFDFNWISIGFFHERWRSDKPEKKNKKIEKNQKPNPKFFFIFLILTRGGRTQQPCNNWQLVVTSCGTG